jgi:hypothetical protein
MNHSTVRNPLRGAERLRSSLVDPIEPTDGDRLVDLSDEEPVLPTSTRDDTDEGWGEVARRNDERLLEERPPHWE